MRVLVLGDRRDADEAVTMKGIHVAACLLRLLLTGHRISEQVVCVAGVARTLNCAQNAQK